MKSKSLLLLLASILFFACKEMPIVDYQIIPQPNSIIYTNGSIAFTKDVKVYFAAEVTNEAELLKDYLSTDFGITPQTVKNEKDAEIVLELNDQYNPTKADGYKLDIGRDNILLMANSQAGLLNAVQSLRQIVRAENNKFVEIGRAHV